MNLWWHKRGKQDKDWNIAQEIERQSQAELVFFFGITHSNSYCLAGSNVLNDLIIYLRKQLETFDWTKNWIELNQEGKICGDEVSITKNTHSQSHTIPVISQSPSLAVLRPFHVVGMWWGFKALVLKGNSFLDYLELTYFFRVNFAQQLVN